MIVRAYEMRDLPAMIEIWNEVIEEGVAFPQLELLTADTGEAHFASQSYTAVAEVDGAVCGLYILHPNNVGRCGHIGNASYAVASAHRGQGIGEALVRDSLEMARAHGFTRMQFNAVVESNARARHLYEKLGFLPLGKIPGGFRMKDGHFETICLYYCEL